MKKVVSIALSLVMCLGLLAACGSSSGSTASTSGSSAEGESTGDVTLTYWYWADNDDYAKTMDEMVADFNATNGKGITVVAEQQPWDCLLYTSRCV